MSGKPAARQGDMTRKGLDIVQGSAGVLIGAPTGVACSVCPGGITYANPVNPVLGAKVLPGETDLALPCPLPFILFRAYSSYRTRTPAPVGVFGPGWKAPFDIRLQIRDEGLIHNDSGGRSIHFEPLFPGEISYSRSESLWLARGGVAAQHSSQPLSALWQVLPEDVRLSPHVYLATNSLQGPWWILSWPERVPGADEVLPPEPPAYRVLTVVVDGFGRSLTFHRAAEGDVAGAVTGVTDGAGRRFHMALTTQAQRAEASRKQRASSLSSPASPRSVSSSQVFPDTLPAGTEYGADNGIRLEAVWLTHDPAYPDEQPTAPLARYTYTAGGELRAVYDRSGTQVRGFTYDAEHTGRMVAHHYAGRPESRYRYDDTGRVTEQVNPEGLDYRFEYGESRVIITDSLNRREVLYTEGEGGLKRVVKKEHADGSITRSEYDEAGRLKAQTDAAGRRTEYRLHMASGKLTSVILPDGRTVRYGYNSQRQVTSVTYPDGLRSSRKYDRQGRLAEETSRNGNITRWFYDSSRSGLPCAVEDGTGVRRRITRNRYGQLQAFTDCSGYTTRYEYDRYGQQIAVHREEGISTYSSYNPRGQLVSQRDAQGRETRYEYSAAGDLTATVSPDGKRSTIEYDKRGRPVSVTEGGLTRSMGYDAAGRITVLTNENGSQSTFRYDPVDRLTEQRGFDGRTQRYQYDLTGKLTQSEDEGLITLWHYDASDRITRRTVNGEPAEQWQYDDHGWLTEISHLSEGHRVAVHYGYDDKGRLTGERQTVENPETGEMLWEHETGHAYSEQGLATRQEPDGLPPVEWLTYGSGYLAGMKLGETSAQHLQQSLRLPGQQYDEESGLYYNRNRYYDPLQGRYITQDPIGLRGEWNLYKYPLNPVRFIDSLGLKFHVNGDPSDFNQAVEYLKQDSQMKETIDFLSSSEETINIEYIEGTNVRFNSNNMTIYWNSRASLFCSTELNSKSQSPALGLGHEFAHAQYYLLDKENFMALLSRTDKKYENKEEARVITIIELRAAKTLGECTRGAHSGLPFYRVDGPLQTMKITGTPE
ncbi:RHS repeat family protein [Escherichia coli]|nr:RHS repeat-associated core domain-containing protein [Escherichia coli]TJA49768.1 RHS repeat family protein [Escherichia coli]